MAYMYDLQSEKILDNYFIQNIIISKRERTRMEKVVTIEDVAKRAGVGRGTVDRVIYNRGRVSAETKEKVLLCIKELNYKPNKAARMLAKKGNYKIAVVFHNEEREFWGQIKAGIDRAAEEYKALGVMIDYYVLPKIDIDKQLEIICHVMESRYDGLAIVPYDSDKISDALNRAIDQGIEVVTFNNKDKRVHCCYVGHNGLQSGKTAGKVMSLIAKDNCKYAVISAHSRMMNQIDERSEGFQEVIKKKRKDMQLVGVFVFPEDRKEVYTRVKEIFQTKQIDAVYVTTAIAGVVAKAIEDSALKRKIIFIGHDLTKTNLYYMRKGIIDISIGQEPERQGYAAIDKICKKLLMDERIDQDEYTKISIVVTENIDF